MLVLGSYFDLLVMGHYVDILVIGHQWRVGFVVKCWVVTDNVGVFNCHYRFRLKKMVIGLLL